MLIRIPVQGQRKRMRHDATGSNKDLAFKHFVAETTVEYIDSDVKAYHAQLEAGMTASSPSAAAAANSIDDIANDNHDDDYADGDDAAAAAALSNSRKAPIEEKEDDCSLPDLTARETLAAADDCSDEEMLGPKPPLLLPRPPPPQQQQLGDQVAGQPDAATDCSAGAGNGQQASQQPLSFEFHLKSGEEASFDDDVDELINQALQVMTVKSKKLTNQTVTNASRFFRLMEQFLSHPVLNTESERVHNLFFIKCFQKITRGLEEEANNMLTHDADSIGFDIKHIFASIIKKSARDKNIDCLNFFRIYICIFSELLRITFVFVYPCCVKLVHSFHSQRFLSVVNSSFRFCFLI